MPWEQLSPGVSELHQELIRASWMAHEAAATYSGLVHFDDDDRLSRIEDLPSAYRSAYILFDAWFQGRRFDAAHRIRVSRALAARSLQTPILELWESEQLSDKTALERHLATPRFNPNLRLVQILQAIADWEDGRVWDWCGRFVIGPRGHYLNPQTPAASVDDVPFASLPVAGERVALGRRVLQGLRTESFDAPEADLDFDAAMMRHAGNVSFAIHPDAPVPGAQSGQGEAEWLANVDILFVEPNVLGGVRVAQEFTNTPATVPPGAALVSSLSATNAGIGRHLVSLTRFSAFLDATPTTVAVCVDYQGLLPMLSAEATPEHAPWGQSAGLTVCSVGDLFVLQQTLSLLRLRGWNDVVMHLYLRSPTWGFVLVRERAKAWPLVVHAVAMWEWPNRRHELFAGLNLVEEPDLDAFTLDPTMLVAFYRIVRVFDGNGVVAAEWQAFERRLLAREVAHVRILPAEPTVEGFASEESTGS
jgi:hypothetical protein